MSDSEFDHGDDRRPRQDFERATTNLPAKILLRVYSSHHEKTRSVMMFATIYGVDFSGARLAGRNIWLARLEPGTRRRDPPYRLTDLACLEKLCGTAERDSVLAHLVLRIAASDQALWALDFPFGLPIEVMPAGARWPDQLDFLHEWGDDAYGAGLECLRRARARGGPLHIRRLTDVEAKAPFDCYHYRIIYQTCRYLELRATAACG
jgi:hypothetical protein